MGKKLDKDKLTDKQAAILLFIKEHMSKKGYPPSVREICKAVSLSSTSSVHSHLSALKKKGYLRAETAKPRTLEVLRSDAGHEEKLENINNSMIQETVTVPILGDVAAGEPIFAEENINSYFPFPVDMLPNTEVFMLRVKGDSMINAGIHNGDYITVARQNVAENGDYVVALIEDSATVKTYYNEGDHIRLQPENDTMSPIIVKDCVILGKVIGLLRMYNNKI